MHRAKFVHWWNSFSVLKIVLVNIFDQSKNLAFCKKRTFFQHGHPYLWNYEILFFFFNKTKIPNYFSYVFSLFLCKTCWTIQKSGNFNNLSFFKSLDLGFESKTVFFAVFGWYFAPWIRIRIFFADSDPGSQNHPDPKHCLLYFLFSWKHFFWLMNF